MKKLACFAMATTALLVTQTAAIGAAQPEPTPKTENRLVFSTTSAMPEEARTLEKRLQDPTQRQALLAEQRTWVQRSYLDVGRVLGIDAATTEALLDVLADQKLQRLVSTHARKDSIPDDYLVAADAETERLDALRALLGQEGFERFRDYVQTAGARLMAHRFDATLNSADKLRPGQMDRLVALLHADTEQEIQRQPLRLPLHLASAPNTPVDAAAMRRNSQLQTIELNEDLFRRREVSNRELEQRTAAFLSNAQQAAFVQYNAADREKHRDWIVEARTGAGLDAIIPDKPSVAMQDPRTRFDGNVKIELTFQVNRNEPTRYTHIGINGKTFGFQAAEGLWLEGTPVLYTDDLLEIHFVIFEPGSKGKRRLTDSFGSTFLVRMPDGSAGGSGGQSMITGSKAYAIRTVIKGQAL